MPELPDVEALRSGVERACRGKRLLRVVLKEQGGGPREGMYDEIVLSGATEADVKRAIEGKVLTAVRRKGKCMWLVLSSSPSGGGKKQQEQHLLMHMGMTGSLMVKGEAIPQYKSFSVSAAAWPPKFTKAEFHWEGGVALAYCDPRRLGRIALKADAGAEPPVSELAPDAWRELPDLAAWKARLQSCDLPVKALLLDQNKLVSGVGNWVADEILFQARVDPAKRCRSLTDGEIAAIRTQTFQVCDVACKANADAAGFPEGWLFHHRWASKAKGAKMPNGAAIVFETIGGRTTAIVPSVQRARGAKAAAAATSVKQEDEDEDEDEDAKPAAPRTKGKGKRKATTAAPAAAAAAASASQASKKLKKESAAAEATTMTTSTTNRATRARAKTAATTTAASSGAKGKGKGKGKGK